MIRTRTLATALLATCLVAATASASHPNTTKYKDTGVPNAHGHSSNASIEARALLDRDATTDVEVTTGSFEPGQPASGTIEKVKVEVPTASGSPKANFNHVDGATFSGKISGVISGDIVSIDAHVRGVDSGTDHAVAQATVAKRPDLSVLFVSPPGAAVKGTIGRVRTAIKENNGEVGARANVRLLIDNVEVDRAENIWVNAGGRVSVAFAPVIEAEDGRHDFTIVVDSMNPGDWDESNNTMTAPDIRVYNVLDEFYSWTASASEQEFDNYDYQKRSWTEITRHDQGVTQSFRFEGVIAAAVNLNTLSATASGVSDGNPLFQYETHDFNVFRTPVGTTCATSNGQHDVVACFDPRNNFVTVDMNTGTGDAVYRSWGWATRQTPFAPPEPMFTWDDTFEEHSLQSRFGSTLALNFTVADGTNHWTSEPFISSLTTAVRNSNTPYNCRFESFTHDTVCRQSYSNTSTKSGSTSGSAE
jgi:hypothetical protein